MQKERQRGRLPSLITLRRLPESALTLHCQVIVARLEVEVDREETVAPRVVVFMPGEICPTSLRSDRLVRSERVDGNIERPL